MISNLLDRCWPLKIVPGGYWLYHGWYYAQRFWVNFSGLPGSDWPHFLIFLIFMGQLFDPCDLVGSTFWPLWSRWVQGWVNFLAKLDDQIGSTFLPCAEHPPKYSPSTPPGLLTPIDTITQSLSLMSLFVFMLTQIVVTCCLMTTHFTYIFFSHSIFWHILSVFPHIITSCIQMK